MNLIILGPQGSGKGTQAELLAKKYNLIHIDMGSFLREMAKQDTPLGKEIYDIQNVTKTLVPKRILKQVVHLKLGSIPREQGIVFDGAPRTMDQAEYMEEAFQEFGRKIDKVFFVNIPKEESIRRISKRRVCEKCGNIYILGKTIKEQEKNCALCGGRIIQRIDDTEEGIRKRLEVFAEETMPVVDYFREKGLVAEVDSTRPLEIVFSDIDEEVKKIL
jgi:adenylate kinase